MIKIRIGYNAALGISDNRFIDNALTVDEF